MSRIYYNPAEKAAREAAQQIRQVAGPQYISLMDDQSSSDTETEEEVMWFRVQQQQQQQQHTQDIPMPPPRPEPLKLTVSTNSISREKEYEDTDCQDMSISNEEDWDCTREEDVEDNESRVCPEQQQQVHFQVNPLFGIITDESYSDLPDLIDDDESDDYYCVTSEEWDDNCAIDEVAEESFDNYNTQTYQSAIAHEFETHIESLLRDMWRDADRQSRGFNFSAPEWIDFPPFSVLIEEGLEKKCDESWPAFPIEWEKFGEASVSNATTSQEYVPEFPSNYDWPEPPEYPPLFEFGAEEVSYDWKTQHEISTYDLLISKLEEGLLEEEEYRLSNRNTDIPQTIDDAIAVCDEMLSSMSPALTKSWATQQIITECDAVLSQIPSRLLRFKDKTD